jgi:hypothetical protein
LKTAENFLFIMTYRIGNEMINSGETFIKYLIGVKNIGMSKIQSKIGCILIEKKKDISKLSLFFFFQYSGPTR